MWPGMATCACTAHGTQPRAISFPPGFSSPLISAIAVLSSSPSSPVSPPSTTVDAITATSLHSVLRPQPSLALIPLSIDHHCLCLPVCLPPIRLPSTSAPISLFLCLRRRFLLFPSSSFYGHPPCFLHHCYLPPSPLSSATIVALRPFVSVTKTERRRCPLVSSSSHHRSSRLLFLSISDYYLDHHRRLPSLFLSLAPPSASRHHLPLLPLLRAHESSHRPLPPSPFPPPSTIKLLSPFSLSVAVIPTPSPSSPASIDADLLLLSLSSLIHLVVGSLLLLPITDPTSISPSAASLAPLRLHRLKTTTTSLLPLRPPSSAAAIADLPVGHGNFSP